MKVRQLCIDPLAWTPDGPRCVGPTTTPQPRPGAAGARLSQRPPPAIATRRPAHPPRTSLATDFRLRHCRTSFDIVECVSRPRNDMRHQRRPGRSVPAALRGPAARLFRSLLPYAERDEVLADLAGEYADRDVTPRPHGRAPLAVAADPRLRAGAAAAQLVAGVDRFRTARQPDALRGTHVGELDHRPAVLGAATREPADLHRARRAHARLGAGGTAAIFSVVRTLLLEPLPIAREAEVGVFWMPGDWNGSGVPAPAAGRPRVPAASPPTNRKVQRSSARRRAAACCRASPPPRSCSRCSAPARCSAERSRAGDDRPGAQPVAVLSHGLWQELGGDPAHHRAAAAPRRHQPHRGGRDAARVLVPRPDNAGVAVACARRGPPGGRALA